MRLACGRGAAFVWVCVSNEHVVFAGQVRLQASRGRLEVDAVKTPTWKVPEAPFPVICSSCPFSTAFTRAVFRTSGLWRGQRRCTINVLTRITLFVGLTLWTQIHIHLVSILKLGKCCSRYFLIRLYEASLGSQSRVMMRGRASPRDSCF